MAKEHDLADALQKIDQLEQTLNIMEAELDRMRGDALCRDIAEGFHKDEEREASVQWTTW